MGTYTANYQLYMPSIGEQGWGDLMNGNLTTIDTTMGGLNTRVGMLETETDAVEARVTAIEQVVSNGDVSAGTVNADTVTGNVLNVESLNLNNGFILTDSNYDSSPIGVLTIASSNVKSVSVTSSGNNSPVTDTTTFTIRVHDTLVANARYYITITNGSSNGYMRGKLYTDDTVIYDSGNVLTNNTKSITTPDFVFSDHVNSNTTELTLLAYSTGYSSYYNGTTTVTLIRKPIYL